MYKSILYIPNLNWVCYIRWKILFQHATKHIKLKLCRKTTKIELRTHCCILFSETLLTMYIVNRNPSKPYERYYDPFYIIFYTKQIWQLKRNMATARSVNWVSLMMLILSCRLVLIHLGWLSLYIYISQYFWVI